jgi:hypothetical protein
MRMTSSALISRDAMRFIRFTSFSFIAHYGNIGEEQDYIQEAKQYLHQDIMVTEDRRQRMFQNSDRFYLL